MKLDCLVALGNVLPQSFRRLERDPRVSCRHMAVFLALLGSHLENGLTGPVCIFGAQGATMSKMSLASYFSCLRDLHDFGYVHYVRSFDRTRPSRIYLKGLCPESIKGKQELRYSP